MENNHELQKQMFFENNLKTDWTRLHTDTPINELLHAIPWKAHGRVVLDSARDRRDVFWL